jgi:glycosyltransferase involved in cell wall biosynthesis
MFREVLPKFDGSDGANVATQLAAAASVGNISTMRQLVNAPGKDKFLWDNSFSFGYPLMAAAAGNHMDVVKTLTARFKNNYRTTPNGEYESAFQNAIDASLTEQHSAMSSLLLEVYHHYFAVLPDKVYDSWLAKAVTDPDDNIILMLGTLRTENGIDSYLKAFKLACKSNNKDRVRVFFESNFLGYNQGYLQGARCPL